MNFIVETFIYNVMFIDYKLEYFVALLEKSIFADLIRDKNN